MWKASLVVKIVLFGVEGYRTGTVLWRHHQKECKPCGIAGLKVVEAWGSIRLVGIGWVRCQGLGNRQQLLRREMRIREGEVMSKGWRLNSIEHEVQ